MYKVVVKDINGEKHYEVEEVQEIGEIVENTKDYVGMKATRVPDKVKKIERGIENESNRCNKQ